MTGHFHTLTYDREVLAEIFQKNLTRPKEEEERIYELMRHGKRFALAGTSDTHDSMPGNPYPEPHLSMPAGFTGVYAKELTASASGRRAGPPYVCHVGHANVHELSQQW